MYIAFGTFFSPKLGDYVVGITYLSRNVTYKLKYVLQE